MPEPQRGNLKVYQSGPKQLPLVLGKRTESTWPEVVMDKMALTIKQGFSLPKKELTIFDGDPLEYWNFIKSFENSITANATSESEKLVYLLQYT